MGSDILYYTPCCNSGDYTVEHEKGKCQYCDGEGVYAVPNGPDDYDYEECTVCDGKRWLKADKCRCGECNEWFWGDELKEDIVDYRDEG